MLAEHPILAALAVVIRERELLLVQRRNMPDAGLWGYPGGRVEWGETVQQAATRELREETGVLATPSQPLTQLDVIRRDLDGSVSHHFHLVAVLCRFDSGEAQAADDAMQVRWTTFDDVLEAKMPMSRDVDTVLRIALDRVSA